MTNIVIATLGDSPIVVTGMYLKVKEQIGTIDKMVVLLMLHCEHSMPIRSLPA